MAKLFILLALTATFSPALAQFGTKSGLKSLTSGLSKVSLSRRLEGHEMPPGSEACMKVCTGFEAGFKAVSGLGEDPPMDKIAETMCTTDHIDTMKCIAKESDCSFAKETVGPIMCMCDCKDLGAFIKALDTEDDKPDWKKACPIMESSMSCVEDTDTCSALKPMLAPMKKGNMMKTACLMDKEGCDMEAMDKCENKDADACSATAMGGGDLDASCCDAIKTSVECAGGQKCFDLQLGLMTSMDESGEVGKVIDKWAAACPDNVKTAADMKKNIEDAKVVEPEKESEADDAMRQFRAGSNSFVLFLGAVGAALFLLR